MERRQYLEAAAGAILAAGAGCLGDADTTGTSETTTAETTRETTAEALRDSESGPTSTRTNEAQSGPEVPSLSLTFEYAKEDDVGRVAITHSGGDSLAARRVTVTLDGTVAFEAGSVVTSKYREATNEWKETVATDDTLAVRGGRENAITEYQTVEIEWTPEDGGDSVLIGMSDVRF